MSALMDVSGTIQGSPRDGETPRTRNVKDIRKKRLAYFASQQARNSCASTEGQGLHKNIGANKQTSSEHSQKTTPRNAQGSTPNPRPLFRPLTDEKTRSPVDKEDEQPTRWSDSRECAQALNRYVTRLQGAPAGSDEPTPPGGEHSHAVSDMLARDSRNSSDDPRKSPIVADLVSVTDDDISDVTEITSTDILLSNHFADKPISDFKNKSQRKSKSSARVDRINPVKSSAHSPRTSQKLAKSSLAAEVNASSQSPPDSSESKQKSRPEDSISTLASSAIGNLLGEEQSALFESVDTSLFRHDARATPLSRDFVAASCDSDAAQEMASGGDSLKHTRLPVSLHASQPNGFSHGASETCADFIHQTEPAMLVKTSESLDQLQREIPPSNDVNGEMLADWSIAAKGQLANGSHLSGSDTEQHMNTNECVSSKTAESVDVISSSHKARDFPNGNIFPDEMSAAPKRQMAESLNFTNLSMVLGEEKLRRLLQNFEESEDFDELEAGNSVSQVDGRPPPAQGMDKVNIWSSIDSSSAANGLDNEDTKDLRAIPEDLGVGRESDLPPLITPQSVHFHRYNSRFMKPSQRLAELTPTRDVSVKEDQERDVYAKPPSYEDYKTKSIDLGDWTEKEISTHISKDISFSKNTSSVNQRRGVFDSMQDEESAELQGAQRDIYGVQGVKESFQDDDLGLETHRPSSYPTNDLLYSSMKQSYDYGAFCALQNGGRLPANEMAQSEADVSNVTYCFSVDQIYAQADAVNLEKPNKHPDPSFNSSSVENTEVLLPKGKDLTRHEVGETDNRKESGGTTGVPKAKPAQTYVTPVEFRKQITVAKSTNFEACKKPPRGSVVEPGSQSADVTRMGNPHTRSGPQGDYVPEAKGKGPKRATKMTEERGQGDAARSQGQAVIEKVTSLSSSGNGQKTLALSNMEEVAGSHPVPPSVERYFQSLEREHLSSVTSSEVTFEPVPEQDIEATPRNEENGFILEGEGVTPESATGETRVQISKIHHEAKRVQQSNSSMSEADRVKESEKKEATSGKMGGQGLKSEVQLVKSRKQKKTKSAVEKPSPVSTVESCENSKGKEVTNGKLAATSVSEDDLYNTVQAALAEINTNNPGEIEKKLHSLGIDFEFLRASQNSAVTSSQQSSVAKLPHSSTNGVAKFQQRSAIGQVADASPASGKTNKYYSQPTAKPVADVMVANDVTRSACVCPECAEISPTGTRECAECGTSLVDVKPVPVHSSKSPRVSVIQQRKTSNRKVEQAAKAAGTMGLDDTLKSQLTLNLKTSTDSTLTNVTRTDASRGMTSQSWHRTPKDNNGGMSLESSISLEYSEGSGDPRKSIPRDLQAQLSIDVQGSSDSSLLQIPSKGKGKSLKKKSKSNSVQDIRVTDDASQDSASVQNNHEAPPLPAVLPANENGGGGEGEGHDVDDEAHTERSAAAVQTEEQNGYLLFLQRLAQDPRLRGPRRNVGQGTTPAPTAAQGRPKSASAKKSYSDIESKVRASWDKEAPSRHWEKSNLAWTSFNSRELLKPPGTGLTTKSLQIRPSSAGRSREGALPARPQSAGKTREISVQDRPVSAGKSRESIGKSRELAAVAGRQRPRSAEYGRRGAALHQDCSAPVAPDVMLELEPVAHVHRASLPLLNVQPVKAKENKLSKSQNSKLANHRKYLSLAQGYTGKLYDIDETSEASPRTNRWQRTLADAIQMSPRVRSGDISFMLCLPDEILLHIFSLLKHKELAKVMQVCRHFRRVASDDSLWRTIVLRKSQNVTDAGLAEIGRKQPRSLSLIQCHGGRVTNAGLRELFRQCAESLEELNFTGCSRGQLTGDCLLLHAASRCVNITSLDASWCNVNDQGVVALAESSQRLESLSVNGCQQLSDEALIAVVNKHGIYLHTLELFGCFNVTARAIASLSNHCKSLKTLNLGQCWKLTDTCIANFAPSLQHVEHLDLRGCKQIKDLTVHQVVKHCPRLETLALANCVNLTDASLAEIATYCAHIESLDLCGCKLVSNVGMRSLGSCHRLQYLDVSSTAVTGKGVSTIASYCCTSLEVLKVNFCKQIAMPCLVRLTKNCKKLQKLFLYGVRGLGPLIEIRNINETLLIETDQARSNPLYP